MATIVASEDRAAGHRGTRSVGIAIILLGLALAAALSGIGLMRGGSVRTPDARRAPATPGGSAPTAAALPAAAPPPVQPTVLADLTPDQARASNEAVPYAPGKLPKADHFIYVGSAIDRDAAETCLAAAVLYEAGDDKAGEQAVAQVVLNRLRHPAFPKTVCGVVFQGSDRPTGCQFTFTCDGSLGRPPQAEAWRRAQKIADAALSGFVDAKVGTATHYHTDWVVPYWRDTLTKLAKVGTQIFYRWPGAWGMPGAFVGHVQPFERLDPRLVPLAGPEQTALFDAADKTDRPDIALPAAEPAGAGQLPAEVHLDGVSRAALRGSIVRLADPVAGQYVVQLDRDAFPGSYAVMSLALCRQVSDCMVFGWLDAERMPRRLPFIPQGVGGMSFLFRRSSAIGKDQALWNCQQIKRDDPAQCLPGTR